MISLMTDSTWLRARNVTLRVVLEYKKPIIAVIAAAITSQKDKTALPTHIEVDAVNCGLAKDSVVLLEQVRTIDKRRLKEKMGSLDNVDMGKVDHALTVSFGL